MNKRLGSGSKFGRVVRATLEADLVIVVPEPPDDEHTLQVVGVNHGHPL